MDEVTILPSRRSQNKRIIAYLNSNLKIMDTWME